MSWIESNPVSANMVGSAISDASNIGAALINYFTQKSINKTNKELNEMAYQQNIEQWGRENAYNHPAAQMARLAEAGLNPNLVYGSGSAVQTSARSPQMNYDKMEAPNLEFQLSNFVADALNAKLKVSEIQKTEAETEGVKIQNAINGFIAAMKEIESAGYADFYEKSKQDLEAGIDLKKSQKSESDARTRELDAQREERKQRKDQLERENKFWSEHPELFATKKILDVLEPILPGIGNVVRLLFERNARKGKKSIEKRDSEGNVIGWTFESYE